MTCWFQFRCLYARCWFLAMVASVLDDKVVNHQILTFIGEQYWLSDKQIKELNERNKQFLTPDPASEMIVTYFTIPRTESETKYMTASKIAAKFAPCLTISPTKIGIALANLGFEQVRTYKGRFWKVADRPGKEIDSRLPGEEPEPLPF